MVSKDQSIGGAIFIICVVIAVLYTLIVFFPQGMLGMFFASVDETQVRIWAVLIPVFIAFIAIMGIGAWIGWTMATTPPPKPIEEITSEIEEEEKKRRSSQRGQRDCCDRREDRGKGKG